MFDDAYKYNTKCRKDMEERIMKAIEEKLPMLKTV